MTYKQELLNAINKEHYEERDIFILTQRVNKKNGYISLHEFAGRLSEDFSVRLGDKNEDTTGYVTVTRGKVSIEVRPSDFDLHVVNSDSWKRVVSIILSEMKQIKKAG